MMRMRMLMGLACTALCMLGACSPGNETPEVPRKPEREKNVFVITTEAVVNGVRVADTRAVTERFETTGDGLYDKGDWFTVTAKAKPGYELLNYYEKNGKEEFQKPTLNPGGVLSHEGRIMEDLTFRVETVKIWNVTLKVEGTGAVEYGASPFVSPGVKSLNEEEVKNLIKEGKGTVYQGSSLRFNGYGTYGQTFLGWYEDGKLIHKEQSLDLKNIDRDRNIVAKFTREKPRYEILLKRKSRKEFKMSNHVWLGTEFSFSLHTSKASALADLSLFNPVISLHGYQEAKEIQWYSLDANYLFIDWNDNRNVRRNEYRIPVKNNSSTGYFNDMNVERSMKNEARRHLITGYEIRVGKHETKGNPFASSVQTVEFDDMVVTIAFEGWTGNSDDWW